jgi:hypothetical protein
MAEYGLVNRDPELGGYSTQSLPTHPEYQNFIRRWKYYINSYMGGTQYKMGQYLTKYVFESEGDYVSRIAQTPLDNQVKSVVHIFNSFLYRNEPKRDLGSLENAADMIAFFKDCDMEGRSFESFMSEVNLMSSIYGHVAVLCDRPELAVGTRAAELEQGIRPYVTIYTPENILDWKFRRLPSGHYDLEYVSFLEQEERLHAQANSYYLRTWTKDKIILEEHRPQSKKKVTVLEEKPNPIGKIPVTWVYANRSPIRGIGVSDIGDIADMQNAIYNELNEIEQLIRISNAPSLVKTNDTDAAAGPGAIITMPDNLDPGLRPQLLQPNGANLEAILKSIASKIESIDKMAHLGAIRSTESRQMSGVSRQSEFLMLDAKLNEKARNLELAEEQIFRNWALWAGTVFDGEIKYGRAFHVRDKNLDMELLKKASETQRDAANASPEIKKIIDLKTKEILAKDEDEFEEMNQEQSLNTTMTHTPMTNVNDMIKHMREMVSQGYTDEQIKQLHPEMEKFFSNDSPEEL